MSTDEEEDMIRSLEKDVQRASLFLGDENLPEEPSPDAR